MMEFTIAGLPIEVCFGEIGQIHPHGRRQAGKQQDDKEEQQEVHLATKRILHDFAPCAATVFCVPGKHDGSVTSCASECTDNSAECLRIADAA